MPDPSIKDWTVDGVLAHAEQVAAEEEVFYYSGEISVLFRCQDVETVDSEVLILIVHDRRNPPHMFIADTFCFNLQCSFMH